MPVLQNNNGTLVPMSGDSSNAVMGQGYGTCTTAESTTAKLATLADYELMLNGVVSIRFTNSVPASSTLNINSNDAKAIYYKGSAIPTGIIRAGDTATFFYDGTYYHLTSVDRQMEFNFDTVALMNAAITAGTVPNGAICHVGSQKYEVINGEAKPIFHVNPNLLDNWYFVGGGSQQGEGQFPINQRDGYIVPPDTPYYHMDNIQIGTTNTYYIVKRFDSVYGAIFDIDGAEYNTRANLTVPGYTGAGYGIDRWKVSIYDGNQPSTIMLSDRGLTCKASTGKPPLRLVQDKEFSSELYMKLGTFSILTSDGNLYYTIIHLKNLLGGRSLGTEFDFFSVGGDNLLILDVKKEVTIVAMKLELGTEQTLAHQDANGNWVLNEIPNYQQELEKCQRYSCVIMNDSSSVLGRLEAGKNEITAMVPYVVTPRANGTVVNRINVRAVFPNHVRNGYIESGSLAYVTSSGFAVRVILEQTASEDIYSTCNVVYGDSGGIIDCNL